MYAFCKNLLKLRLYGGAICAAALLAPAVSTTVASAQGFVQGTCVTNRTTFLSRPDCTQVSSSSFVDIPETSVNVKVGGANPTCVIVAFSALVNPEPDETMVVRARIAGIGAGDPDDVAFGPGSGKLDTRATQFIFRNVPPGSHTLQMQYRINAGGSGDSVRLCEPTLVVHHR